VRNKNIFSFPGLLISMLAQWIGEAILVFFCIQILAKFGTRDAFAKL